MSAARKPRQNSLITSTVYGGSLVSTEPQLLYV